MLRPCLVLSVLLAVACDAGPTAPDVARAPPSLGLTAEAVAAMHALLDDPFVHDVTVQADQTAQHTMQDVMDRVATGEPHAILRALAEAHRRLRLPNNDEAVVSRAALGLTLSAVKTVLDSAVEGQTDEGDAIPVDRRGGHDD